MRRLLGVLRDAMLALFVLVVVLCVAAVLFLRSPNGRDRVVAAAVAQLRPLLSGELRVARVDGDLAHGLVLFGVELLDLQGRRAVFIERLEVRYSLRPLLGRVLAFSLVRANGVIVVSRELDDGGDSLTTLLRSGPATATPGTGISVAVDLERVELDGRLLRVGSGARASGVRKLQLRVDGSASLGRNLALRIGRLRIALETPAHLSLRASGVVGLGDRTVHNLVVDADVDSLELRRQVAALALRGRVALHLVAQGSWETLGIAVAVRAPAERMRLRARLRLDQRRLHVHDLDFAAPFARLNASGVGGLDGRFALDARASVSDLAGLVVFGAPPIFGRASLEGNLQGAAGSLRGHVEARAEALRLPGASARAVALRIDAIDLTGRASLEAHGLQLGKVLLSNARIEANATATSIRLAASGAGPEETSAHLLLVGVPLRRAGHLVGADAWIEQLRLAGGASVWREKYHAHLSADLERGQFELSPMQIVGPGDAEIIVAARLRERSIEAASLELKHFDLSKLDAILSPGHVLPHTDVYLLARGRGDLGDPEIHARVSGVANGLSQKDFIRLSGQAEAHLLRKRVSGNAFLTIGGQKLSAKVDLPFPLRPHAPVDVSLDASVLLSPTFAEMLVPKLIQFQPQAMFTLSGTVTANLRLTGSTSDPEVHAGARLAGWESEGAHGSFGASLEYRARSLGASLTADFSSLPRGGGQGGGQITATTRVAMDLGAWLSGRGGRVLSDAGLLQGMIVLKHVGIDHLPLRAFNFVPPLQHGRVDGLVTISGTRRQPRLNARFEAEGFDAVALGVSGLSGLVSARSEGSSISGELRLSVRGAEALHLRGSLDAGQNTDPATADYQHAPLAVLLESNGFPLDHVGVAAGLAGLLRGETRLGGTLAALDASLQYDVEGLALGATSYERFAVGATRRAGLLSGHLVARQVSGGQLEVRGRMVDSELDGELAAQRFVIDLEGEKLPGLRVLRGLLDAELRLAGTRRAPALRGTVTLAEGELALPSTAITYRDIRAGLRVEARALEIERLELRAGRDGSASVRGRVGLLNLRPTSLKASLRARRFPVQRPGGPLLLDGELGAEGRTGPDGVLRGHLRLLHGSLVPKEQRLIPGLHPTGPLADVRILATSGREPRLKTEDAGAGVAGLDLDWSYRP